NEKWQADLPDNVISNFVLSDSGSIYFAVKDRIGDAVKIKLYDFGPGGSLLMKPKAKIVVSDDLELDNELNLALDEFDYDLEPEIKEEFDNEDDLYEEDICLESDALMPDNEQPNVIIENRNIEENPEIGSLQSENASQPELKQPEAPEQLQQPEAAEEPVQQKENEAPAEAAQDIPEQQQDTGSVPEPDSSPVSENNPMPAEINPVPAD
ncbi:MAG: hypothetical protein PHP01_08465, partial [Phycisphaerae bacterium]|nr:hypothetical protein [Phycisphaerae bacterium]